MPKTVNSAVVVITGASSGIGRAAALEFARQGAALGLAARSESPLHTVADECRRLGGRALAIPTDVTDEQAVRNLARRVVEEYGRLDIWVNNAAVSLLARFDEIPPEGFRRVIETNLFGYAYGAWAALPYFRSQNRGVLINVSSVVGKFGQPFASAYVASKFAILGLSECLRQELRHTNIRVCAVLPASIDTPLFQHAANYTGRAPQPMWPMYSAEQVARAILSAAKRPRREVYAGATGRLAVLMHTIAPGLMERIIARQVEKQHLQKQTAQATPGNLFEAQPQWDAVSGGWKNHRPARAHHLATLGLAAIPALAGWFRWRRKSQ